MNHLNFTFSEHRNISPVFSRLEYGHAVAFDLGPTYCSLAIDGLPRVSQRDGELIIEATSEHFDEIADFLNKFNFGTKSKVAVHVKKVSKKHRKQNARRSNKKNK